MHADDPPSLSHGRTTHEYILLAYLGAISNELWKTPVFHLIVRPGCQFCSAFFELALLKAVTEPERDNEIHQIRGVHNKTLHINAYKQLFKLFHEI